MKDKSLQQHYLFFVAALGAIGGFLFGYNTAIISGLLFIFTDLFHLSIFQKGWVVSALVLGALFGGASCGYISDKLGRKKTVIITSFLYAFGALLLICAEGFPSLIIGRFIIGLGAGFGSLIMPLYLSEMSPVEKRGRIVTTNQLMITVGILVSYLLNHYFQFAHTWRYLFVVSLVAALAEAIYMLYLPESPAWLLSNKERNVKKTKERLPFTSLVILGLSLSVIHQITGINAIIYYAPSILIEGGGLTLGAAMIITIWIGVLNVVATVFGMWQMDKWGRRPLLLMGLGGMFISLSLLSYCFLFHEQIGLLAILGLMVYVGSFAVGLGCVTFVILSEIYPIVIRGKVMGLAFFANWGTNFLLTFFFLPIVKEVGSGHVFAIFALLTLISFFLLYRFLPETKGTKLT